MRILILLAFLASDDLCKAQANWALILWKDVQAGWSVNVMPADQYVLDLVQAHKGTREELWYRVLYACKGPTT